MVSCEQYARSVIRMNLPGMSNPDTVALAHEYLRLLNVLSKKGGDPNDSMDNRSTGLPGNGGSGAGTRTTEVHAGAETRGAGQAASGASAGGSVSTPTGEAMSARERSAELPVGDPR